MENEKINVRDELKRLDYNFGKIMATSAGEEAKEVRKILSFASQKIQDFLVEELGVHPRNAEEFVRGMNDKQIHEITKSILNTREEEYYGTKKNIDIIATGDKKRTIEELGEFQQGGIVISNSEYRTLVENVRKQLIKDYTEKLSKVGNNYVINGIRGIINKNIDTVLQMHDEYSKRMIKDCNKGVEALGDALKYEMEQELLDKVEAEVVRIGQEHGLIDREQEKAVIIDSKGEKHEITDPDELAKIDKIDSELAKKFVDSTSETPTSVTGVDGDGNVHTTTDPEEIKKIETATDKAAKAFNDFASSLQSQTKTEEEISKSDAEDLSENQKAFKDSPARDEDRKKHYESMFK